VARRGLDIEVLRRGDVSLSLFTPRGADHQSVHKQDEVYLVIAGTGLLRSGDVEHAFVPGALCTSPPVRSTASWATHRPSDVGGLLDMQASRGPAST